VGWGVAWVALQRAFPQTKKKGFLMISPYLYDFWPVFLLIFSHFETADFFMQKTASAAQQCIQERSRPQHHTLNSKPLLFLLLNIVHYFHI
jgi:hypothetical protein